MKFFLHVHLFELYLGKASENSAIAIVLEQIFKISQGGGGYCFKTPPLVFHIMVKQQSFDTCVRCFRCSIINEHISYNQSVIVCCVFLLGLYKSIIK